MVGGQQHLLPAEEDADEDHEGGEDPDDKDPLVEDVVEGEPHVGGELLQTGHVLLHGEGEAGRHQLLRHELGPEGGGGDPGEALVDREEGDEQGGEELMPFINFH